MSASLATFAQSEREEILLLITDVRDAVEIFNLAATNQLKLINSLPSINVNKLNIKIMHRQHRLSH